MPNSSYRGLRIVLAILAAFMAVGGVLMIISTKALILRMFFAPPEPELTTLLLAAVKEMGGLLLMLSAMVYFAYRDPVRNVAIVNGLIVGLCVLTVTPLISLYTLDVRSLYPAYMIWARALTRLAVAVLLYCLRPKVGAGTLSRE